jgi:hypothetical protein
MLAKAQAPLVRQVVVCPPQVRPMYLRMFLLPPAVSSHHHTAVNSIDLVDVHCGFTAMGKC